MHILKAVLNGLFEKKIIMILSKNRGRIFKPIEFNEAYSKRKPLETLKMDAIPSKKKVFRKANP